jgi:hypothetical protein
MAGISIPAVRDSAHPVATIGAVVARGTDGRCPRPSGRSENRLDRLESTRSDGVTYSSREHPTVAQRRRLRVSFGASPCAISDRLAVSAAA